MKNNGKKLVMIAALICVLCGCTTTQADQQVTYVDGFIYGEKANSADDEDAAVAENSENESGTSESVLKNPIRNEDDTITYDTVYFGNYFQSDANGRKKDSVRWLVLSVNEDSALLLSEVILDCRKYQDVRGNNTWRESELRKWLNNTFLKRAFSSEERKAIKITKVNDTRDIEKICKDKVTILESEELSDVNQSARVTAYAKKRGAITGTAKEFKDHGHYWIRDSGEYMGTGSIMMMNCAVNEKIEIASTGIGVRPALTIDMTQTAWKKGEEVTVKGVQSPVDIQKIKMGYKRSGLVTASGDLYTWGKSYIGNGLTYSKNDIGESFHVLDNVRSYDECEEESVAVTLDGDLYMWGRFTSLMLGKGKSGDSYRRPKKIMSGVASACLGDGVIAVIKKDGDLYTWGSNRDGKAGAGMAQSYLKAPKKILSNVKEISMSRNHGAALTKKGDVYVWGKEIINEEGLYSPKKIMSGVAAVSVSERGTAILDKKGNLYMVGNTMVGHFANGKAKRNGVWKSKPTKIMSGVKKVSVGTYHCAAIKNDGSLYTWGCDYYGELGNGKSRGKSEKPKAYKPVKVLDGVRDVSAGWFGTAAITEDGAVYQWGRSYGEGEDDESTPQKIWN